MARLKVKFILLLLILVSLESYSQRHYKGISSLEMNYGTNVFGKADNYANISFGKYINRKSYWKVGLNYFEKSFDYEAQQPLTLSKMYVPVMETSPVTMESKAKDWYIDGSYNYTFVSNLKSVYWSIRIGVFLGTEYNYKPKEEYQFIVGPEIGTEIELFILPKMAFLVGIKEVWNPLSIKEWNTIWNTGIKILLYK